MLGHAEKLSKDSDCDISMPYPHPSVQGPIFMPTDKYLQIKLGNWPLSLWPSPGRLQHTLHCQGLPPAVL